MNNRLVAATSLGSYFKNTMWSLCCARLDEGKRLEAGRPIRLRLTIEPRWGRRFKSGQKKAEWKEHQQFLTERWCPE